MRDLFDSFCIMLVLHDFSDNTDGLQPRVVSLGTGSKCLGASKVADSAGNSNLPLHIANMQKFYNTKQSRLCIA